MPDPSFAEAAWTSLLMWTPLWRPVEVWIVRKTGIEVWPL